jgi:hypothetical protein
MATQEEQIELAKKAISHVLRRIRDDKATRYQIGFGTQSFALLTEAAAALFDEPVDKVREMFTVVETAA